MGTLFLILFFFTWFPIIYIYLWLLVFVQALHFYFNVVISNSFHFIFEADLLRDSIN